MCIGKRSFFVKSEEYKDFKVSVLIVDDRENDRKCNRLSVMAHLKKLKIHANEINVSEASNMEDAFYILRRQTVHVVLLDRDLGKDSSGQMIDGIDFIGDILNIRPSIQVLMVTGYDDTRLVVRAMQSGACGYIVKDGVEDYVEYRNTQILKALAKAKEEMNRAREKFMDKDFSAKYICKSNAMKRIETQLKTLAQFSTPVLLLGKSGLGKTVTAKRLTQLRSEFLNQEDRPFFNINMANIPKDLADSILFGHEGGAFTGATKTKQGLFEVANGGDLFLDEIGEASLEIQAKLLKVIEEKEFCRVGGDQIFKTSARVILATNKNLKEMVKQGKFREDLYARICIFDITMPALEERKEDIPYICEAIIEDLKRENKGIKFSYDEFPESLQEYLQRDNIPFNIRGIRNDLERLMISVPRDDSGRLNFSKWKSVLGVSRRSVFYSKKPTEYITYSDFENLPTSFLEKDFPGIKKAKGVLEKKLIEEAALKTDTKRGIAKLLQLSESNILAKIDKYNLNHLVEGGRS